MNFRGPLMPAKLATKKASPVEARELRENSTYNENSTYKLSPEGTAESSPGR
jgi:hypothetical protein